MRFPLAAAFLLLSTAFVASTAMGAPTCTSTDDLDVPVQTGTAPGMFAYTATATTSFYLYGRQVGLALAPPSLDACIYIQCGPSTVACTAPAGSYTVQVYTRMPPSSPWALVTIECVATPTTPCA